MNEPFDKYDLDALSNKIYTTNSKILMDGFNEYAFLMKMPPFSLEKNQDTTQEFVKDVRDRYYELSAEVNLDEDFKPWKQIERKYVEQLKEARQYREDSNGNIQAAAMLYQDNNPKYKLSMAEIIGGNLEL